MVFLHINKESKNHKKLDECIKDGNKKIFLLVFMIGCGPCEATKPHWLKLENDLDDEGLFTSIRTTRNTNKWATTVGIN